MNAKQHQHHGPRSPQGKPTHTARFALRCTPAQYRKLMRRGGSAWLRKLIQEA